MTLTVLNNTHDETSAFGCMYRNASDVALAPELIITTLLLSATASTYERPFLIERTTPGMIGQIAFVATESTSEAIMEIRKRSGLTLSLIHI